MNIRPYLTFNGRCADAIELYEQAFNIKAEVSRFKDMPPNPNFSLPDEFMDRILQATLSFGDNFVRLSDGNPMSSINDVDTEKIGLAIEAPVEVIKKAFTVLSSNGKVVMPLAETFFSPCHGTVIDEFGIKWNLVATK